MSNQGWEKQYHSLRPTHGLSVGQNEVIKKFIRSVESTARREGFLEGEKSGISIGKQIAIDNMKRRPTKSGTYGEMNNSDALTGGEK